MASRIFVVGILFAASVRLTGLAWGDTLDLAGSRVFNWEIGWTAGAEAWAGSRWCGDTLSIDAAGNPTLLECSQLDYCPDTGGLTPGAMYINWYYKFRNYYAQLPVIWGNWAGFDATGYKYFMLVYKGLLPVHRMKASFIYGYTVDSTKNKNNLGDGVGIITASPNEWKTVVLQIPDSVDMVGITGVVFAIENAPGKGGKTSDVGNIKVDRIALISGVVGVNHQSGRNSAADNRFYFTPSSGSVVLTAYSLKGEILTSKTVEVLPGKRYSVRRFARDHCEGASSQLHLIAIRGKGVSVTGRMW